MWHAMEQLVVSELKRCENRVDHEGSGMVGDFLSASSLSEWVWSTRLGVASEDGRDKCNYAARGIMDDVHFISNAMLNLDLLNLLLSASR